MLSVRTNSWYWIEVLVNHSEGRFYHRNGNFGAEEKLINMLEIKSIQRRNRKMLFWINESSSLDSQSLELRFLFLRNITIAFIANSFLSFVGMLLKCSFLSFLKTLPLWIFPSMRVDKELDGRFRNEESALDYRPLALRGHVTSFLWKWKLRDFPFETLLVGHLLNKIIVIWFFKPAPFA